MLIPRLENHARVPKGPLTSKDLAHNSYFYRQLLNDERKILYDRVRDFSEKFLVPKTCDIHTGKLPYAALPVMLKDFCSIGIPAKYEGVDEFCGIVDTAILHQNLAYGSASAAAFFDVNGLFPFVLMLAGNEAQQETYVRRIAKGEIIGSYALSDLNCASDVANMKSLSFSKTDSGFVLNGSKIFITNGPIADYTIAFATEKGNSTAYMNISAFIVPAKKNAANGFVSEKPMDKIGWRGSPTSIISFDDVEIPKENLVGELGQGFPIAVTSLAYGRVNVAAEALGLMERVLDEVIKFAQTRPAVGAAALKDTEVFQYQLSYMGERIEAARGMIYNTAFLAESRDKDGMVPSFALEAALAKSFAAKSLLEVAALGVQLHGGNGVTLEYPISVIYADAPIYSQIEGALNVLKIWIGKIMAGGK